ncbi:hypothetical protein N9N28_15875 [Rubripirellula amarantea]|nr:hypothetical protein [Rubripirellula amarantea]
MPFQRLKIAALAAALTAATSSADACCLTDWLYGRQANPYAVGYTPYAAAYTPYTAGYAPIATTNYQSNYSAGYAPTTTLPLTTPVLSSGAYQLQRPAYDNPSVYTGQPVGTNLQTAYSVPMTTPQILRGNTGMLGNAGMLGVGPTSSYMGAANVYPNSSYYRANYAAAQVAVPTGTPMTGVPATNVAPLFPNAPRPTLGSGLSRFFSNLFGTGYRSSYYRAPVTYYRPATTVDPMSGTTVTIQQPCTSTIDQLQRTPFSSLGAAPTTFDAQATYAQPLGQPYPVSSSPDQYGAIGQVSAMETAPRQFTVPIPSSSAAPPSFSDQGYGQPSAAPLTGSPTSPRPQADLSPIDQPRLESYRREESSYAPRNETSYRNELDREPREYEAPASEPDYSREKPKSYWELQDADDSTAMSRPQSRYGAIRPDFQNRQTTETSSFTGIEPIRALDDDEPSPFRRSLDLPAARSTFEAPALPTRSLDRDATSVSTRQSVPVREAAMTSRTYPPLPAPKARSVVREPERDNTWTKASR